MSIEEEIFHAIGYVPSKAPHKLWVHYHANRTIWPTN